MDTLQPLLPSHQLFSLCNDMRVFGEVRSATCGRRHSELLDEILLEGAGEREEEGVIDCHRDVVNHTL